MDANRRFLLILGLAVVPFAVVMTLLLTTVFGSSDMGIRCSRLQGARCEILQSRLMGVAGNSALQIPESRIRGARTSCGQHAVGGRRGTSCSVQLMLSDGPDRLWPVLSYPFFSQAQSATRQLNAYLSDPHASSIALREPVAYLWLLYGGAPLAIIAVVLAVRSRLRAG